MISVYPGVVGMDPFLHAASALAPVLAAGEAPRDYPWALFCVGWAGGVA